MIQIDEPFKTKVSSLSFFKKGTTFQLEADSFYFFELLLCMLLLKLL